MPNNLFSTTIELTKLDVHGNPYRAVVIDDKRLSYAALWQSFTSIHREDIGPGTQAVDAGRVERYETQKLIEHESNMR